MVVVGFDQSTVRNQYMNEPLAGFIVVLPRQAASLRITAQRMPSKGAGTLCVRNADNQPPLSGPPGTKAD